MKMSETSPIHTSTAEGEKAVAVLQAMKERKLGKLLGNAEAHEKTAMLLLIAQFLAIFAALATFAVAGPTAPGVLVLPGITAGILGIVSSIVSKEKRNTAKKYAEKEGLKIETEELK